MLKSRDSSDRNMPRQPHHKTWPHIYSLYPSVMSRSQFNTSDSFTTPDSKNGHIKADIDGRNIFDQAKVG